MGIKSLSRLVESPEAVAKIQAWKQMTPAQRSVEYTQALSKSNGKVVRVTKPGYLIPFSLGADNKIMVPCRILESATGGQVGPLVTAVKDMTKNNVFDTIPGGESPTFEVPVFASAFKRAARVTLKILSGTAGERTSRITGRKYSAKDSDSISQSFGMKKDAGTAADYNDVANEAKTWAAAQAERSYKMTPEGSRA
jgi:hypothetical protein